MFIDLATLKHYFKCLDNRMKFRLYWGFLGSVLLGCILRAGKRKETQPSDVDYFSSSTSNKSSELPSSKNF